MVTGHVKFNLIRIIEYFKIINFDLIMQLLKFQLRPRTEECEKVMGFKKKGKEIKSKVVGWVGQVKGYGSGHIIYIQRISDTEMTYVQLIKLFSVERKRRPAKGRGGGNCAWNLVHNFESRLSYFE